MFKLKINATLYEQIFNFHKSGSCEQISYLFGNFVGEHEFSILLVPEQKPILLSDSCFDVQHEGRVRLKKDVQLKIYTMFAESGFNCLINIHDHPFSAQGTRFSGIDDKDDQTQLEYLSDVIGQSSSYAGQGNPRLVSLVLDQTTFDGREVVSNGFKQLDKIYLLDRKFIEKYSNGAIVRTRVLDESMSRHTSFITQSSQVSMNKMQVAIIGAGGLGSIIAEGLVRLGVRKLIIIDDDYVEKSNLNRLQGARLSDVGKRKVEVIGNHLSELFEDVQIKTISESLDNEVCCNALQTADVIFGALDNDSARLTLTKLSALFLVPYFDLGTSVTIDHEVDFKSRLFVTVPGVTSCMNCSKFEVLDRRQAEYSAVDSDMLGILRSRGYINQLPEDEASPSVYALNMSAVGMLLTEFLNWMNSYKPMATVLLNSYSKNYCQRADSENFEETYDSNCDCCANRLGIGIDHQVVSSNQSKKTSKILEEASELLKEFEDLEEYQ